VVGTYQGCVRDRCRGRPPAARKQKGVKALAAGVLQSPGSYRAGALATLCKLIFGDPPLRGIAIFIKKNFKVFIRRKMK